ncbi:MAG TPA: EAL domain-containing protein [Gemmatimonadaceae bacterium]|nr:EAL domain-containing protein [Gemmatimonadaceae bacterium]
MEQEWDDESETARKELIELLLTPGAIATSVQPIVDYRTTPPTHWGVECLTHGQRGTVFADAEVLFRTTRLARLESEVDRVCVAMALHSMRRIAMPSRIFLNVHPQTLTRDAWFPAYVQEVAERWKIGAERLTIEIVEHDRRTLSGRVLRAVNALREFGVSVALDDCAADLTHDPMLVAVRPEFVKIAKHVVWAARHSTAGFRRLERLVQSTGNLTTLIAEGIETAADLEMVRCLGVSLVQGFFVGRPVAISALHRER